MKQAADDQVEILVSDKNRQRMNEGRQPAASDNPIDRSEIEIAERVRQRLEDRHL